MTPASPARVNRPARSKATEKPSSSNNETGDRFILLNRFVDFSLAKLRRAELAVWFVLYRDTRDSTARTSYDDIARRAGCNRRSVGRAIRRLEAQGLLVVVHKGGLGRGASRYRIHGLPPTG
jgi:hypothetical protein